MEPFKKWNVHMARYTRPLMSIFDDQILILGWDMFMLLAQTNEDFGLKYLDIMFWWQNPHVSQDTHFKCHIFHR